MTGTGFSTDMSPTGPDNTPRSSMSMADILALPEDQRQLMLWLLRQSRVTVADIAAAFDQPEAEAQALINLLVEQGFVQLIVSEDETGAGLEQQISYRAQRIQRRAYNSELDLAEIATINPIAVILSSTGDHRITPGSSLEISLTISNKGNQSAIIDAFIDELPPALHQWCYSTQERLALGADQSGEVVFRFDIPETALPGTYTYWLVVDAPQHYPNSPPLRYLQTLHVLPPLHSVVRVNDPTFAIQPPTSAANPALLGPGEAQEVQIVVFNRSDRVDRFRLTCLDLPQTWVSITYPQGFQQIGLAPEESYLDLNPGDQGTIFMLVMVPLNTLAGSYVATLRLRSENQPELALLELLYLEVRPVYQMDLTFRTLISRVRTQPGLFAVQATNLGNTVRSLQLNVVALDDGKLCTYTLEHPVLQMAPQQTQASRLWVQPTSRWRRPLFGGGRILNFSVEVADVQRHPLPDIPMQGFIVWEARPWWQLLPLVLLLIGFWVALIWFIWWAIFRPPTLPKIARFSSSDTQYSAATNDAVRLNFQINHPNKIQAIEIVGQSPDGKVISGPVTYDFSQGIPTVLQPFCNERQQMLSCYNLLTDARRAGDYLFTLTVIPKPGRGNPTPDRLTLPLVAIAPLPLPQIVALSPTQPSYPEPAPPRPTQTSGKTTPSPSPSPPPRLDRSDRTGIHLNWQIAHPQQIKTLMLVGRAEDGTVVVPAMSFDFSDGVPNELRPFCVIQEDLICQNIPTGTRQAGTYAFELSILPTTGAPEKPIQQITDPIKIQPRPPQILSFQLNGAAVQPKYILPIDQGQPLPNLVLSWEVEATPGTTVELIPAPGTVPVRGSLPLPLSPDPGSSVITLQVKNSAGQQIVRSFTIETYDPTPAEPTVIVNTGDAAAGGANGGANGAGAAGAGGLSAPRPARPGTLSPNELPPQFEP